MSRVSIDEAAIIVLSDKTDLLALGLGGDGHTALGGHGAHLGLGIFAKWEAGMSKLLLVENMQDVGLILAEINATPESTLASDGMVINAYIVAGSQVIGVK